METQLREVVAAASPALGWVGLGLPFDVIRTRLQATDATKYSGALHCLRSTVRNEGVLALWKGFVPQLLISAPYSTILFGTYARLRPSVPEGEELPDAKFFGHVFLAGMCSGVLLTALQNPLDVWRVRVQTAGVVGTSGGGGGNGGSGGGSSGGRVTRQTLFRGLSMTAFRNLPGNGFFFLTNEALKAATRKHPLIRDSFSPATLELLVGGLTGVIFNLALCPAEVMRSRMMATEEGGLRYHASRVLAEHGPLGFFRGAGVTTAKALPVNAAGFALLYRARESLGLEQRSAES